MSSSGMKWHASFSPRNTMLIGQHRHILDPKKRISLPAKFRKELGKKVVLTNGLDHCIFVYSIKEWHTIAAKLGSLGFGNASTRSFNRFLLGGAEEVEIDSAGRILVPDFLKEFAGLQEKVILTGVQNRVEIWDETRWTTYVKNVGEEADALAEKLGEVGLI